MYCGPFSLHSMVAGKYEITWDHMRAIAQRIYGDPASLDPYSGYQAKAAPGFFHMKHSVMKDCLPTDDRVFPMIYTANSPDHYCRLGEIEGPSMEYHLFKAGVGVSWSEEEFNRAAERVYTMERALTVRHWGRDRKMDELTLPSFEYVENWKSPLLDKRYALDRVQFTPVMEDYYRLLGWDPATGWPTREHMNGLGMGEMYAPMIAGAEQSAKERAPLPELGPVPQIND